MSRRFRNICIIFITRRNTHNNIIRLIINSSLMHTKSLVKKRFANILSCRWRSTQVQVCETPIIRAKIQISEHRTESNLLAFMQFQKYDTVEQRASCDMERYRNESCLGLWIALSATQRKLPTTHI